MALPLMRTLIEILNRVLASIVLDGESASSYSRQVREFLTIPYERTQPPPFSPASRSRSQRRVGFRELACPSVRRNARARSEERRVGKECRSRWSPYH